MTFPRMGPYNGTHACRLSCRRVLWRHSHAFSVSDPHPGSHRIVLLSWGMTPLLAVLGLMGPRALRAEVDTEAEHKGKNGKVKDKALHKRPTQYPSSPQSRGDSGGAPQTSLLHLVGQPITRLEAPRR